MHERNLEMKKTSFAYLLLALPFAAGATSVTAPIAVSGTRFWQDRQTQKVTVKYTLANQGEPAWVTMDVLTNGVSIGMQNIVKVSGDISQRGADFTAAGAVADDGTEKTIVWDARKDWYGNIGSNASVVVSAWYTNFVPEVYMVVDLSEGPEAARYPVTLTRAIPDPADLSCVSNRLWLRYIPAGTFKMGAFPDDVGHDYNDNTRLRENLHQVTLTKPFYAGVFEVTRAQYRLVMGAASETSSGSPLRPMNGKKLDELWGEGFDPSMSNDVAETSFFYALRQKTGLLFSLPTDAQWEYACRAGTVTPYNVDTNFLALTDVAWHSVNAASSTHPVGQKAPNAWGLYDMHGNVFELTRDYFVHGLGTSAVTDPLRRSNGASSLSFIIRGGSFATVPQQIRSPYRGWRAPNTATPGEDGIRVFLTLE
jgi:formylglycine-generating enzyme required for sulfatase activity